MPIDPIDRERIERETLEVVLAYYDGVQTLEAAASAIRTLSALPPTDDDGEPHLDDESDASFGLDPATLPAEFRQRYDALMRAIEAAPPDTA